MSPSWRGQFLTTTRMQLDYALGGHTAAMFLLHVNSGSRSISDNSLICNSFSLFCERGRFPISGGNDASLKLWDWSKHFQNIETHSNNDIVSNIDVNKKVSSFFIGAVW